MSQRYIGGLIYNPPGGYSGYFDGSGDYLSVADATALELGGSDFCIEGWYFPQSFGSNLALVSKRANTTSTGAIVIYANSGSGALTFYASANGSSYFWSGSTIGTMVLNQWNHFAVYRSGNNWYGSMNGVVSSMGSSANSIVNNTDAYTIGGDTNGNYANGYISNTRIVIGSAVYGASNFTPPVGPLQAISGTQLLTCAYPTFRDGSTNNFTITVNGNTTVSTQNPFPLTTLPNPAQGGAGNGIFSMSQYQSLKQQNLWPAIDPYFDYTTLLLHGNGTNGGQNNTFLDSGTANSGSGFTITRNGDTTQGTFSPFSVGAGYWSAFFAGGASGGYITSSTSADYTFGTGDFTIEGFVFVTGTGTGIFQQATSNFPLSTTNTVALGTNGGTPTWQMYAKNTSTNSTATWAANNWYHFAVVRSGTTTTLYINGSSVITVTGDSTNYTGTNFGIGSIYGTGSSERFTGYLSNLRVVKGAAVYTANFTPPTSPLTSFGSGTTALIALQSNRYIDTSASPKTLTVTGDTSVQAFSPFAPTAAYSASTVGGSGYFDGSGDYLTVPDNTAFTMGSGDFSVEFWYFPTSSARQLMVAQTNAAGNTLAFWVEKNSSNQLRFVVTVGGTQYVGTATATMNLNSWSFIQVVRSGTTVFGYQNGTQVCSASVGSGSLLDSTDVVEIGGVSVGLPVTGYISDVRILKGTASSSTIPSGPLQAITNTSLLLNFTNAAIIDNTAKNVLETVADAQISTAQSKFGGASLYFDGTGDYLSVPYSPNLNMGTGDFTCEFWVYVPSNPSVSYPSIVGPQDQIPYGIGIRYGNTGYANKFTVHLYGVAGWVGDPILASSSTYSLSQWHHVALTRSGTTLTLWVNGVSAASTTSSNQIDFASDNKAMWIGASFDGANSYFNGYIDDFRITKGIARYTSNFTPQTSQWQDQ